MKWSEQMRELLSEDEHYNQLVYDVDENKLYINGKFIADINDGTVLYNLFEELKKKYPFFTDVNFLLHCVFKYNDGGVKILEKTEKVARDKFTIQIVSHSKHYLYIRTTKYEPL